MKRHTKVWRLLTPQLSPEDLHMLWCRRSPRRTGHSAQRPSGVYVDLDTSIEVQKRTAERVSEESADATWRRERAAREAREKADETQRRQVQRAPGAPQHRPAVH